MRQVLTELEAILNTVTTVNKVSHGKPKPISTENEFTSVYIMPEASTYELRVPGQKLKDYDDFFFVRLIVNTNNTDDDLAWVEIKDDIIRAVLNDTAILTGIIDRNVVTVGFDDYESYPKRELEIVFEFRLRDSNC